MEFYKIACRYLKGSGIRISDVFFRQRMSSHPDYPSLVSFTDTLDEAGLLYSAIIADKDKYTELDYPLLGYMNDRGRKDFQIITSPQTFEENENKLLNQWEGVAVMVKPSQNVSNEQHNTLLKEERSQSRLLWTAGLLVLVAAMTAAVNYFTLPTVAFTFLCMAGIFICAQIILHNLGHDNAITEQLCSNDGSSGCDKVLKSDAAMLWNKISLGDAGLIYFAGVLLFLVFTALTNSEAAAVPLLRIPVILSFVFSIFSLWYQWRVVKQWCRMCLITVGILWLQAAAVFSADIQPLFAFSFFHVILLAGSLGFSSVAWLLLKPLLPMIDKGIKDESELLKWKRNPGIFLSLLRGRRKVDITPWSEDIVLGNAGAAVQLAVVCNPYCGPCSTTHRLLEELLHEYPNNIGLTIRFNANATDNSEDRKNTAIASIIHADRTGVKNENSNPVKDWFEWTDIVKFKEKYTTPVSLEEYVPLLQKHRDWSKQSRIMHTPTVFVNGHELPEEYRVSDLGLLITLLEDSLSTAGATETADQPQA